jgi:hypothetical protein
VKPIHPLRHGAVNAADEAQDRAFPENAQQLALCGACSEAAGFAVVHLSPCPPKVAEIPRDGPRIPRQASFYPDGETPAEIIRTVATLLATLGIGNRNYLTFPTADVIEMRAKLAAAYDALDTTGQRYELTAQGRHCLERSVNDRGPLAKIRDDEQKRAAEWERFRRE